MHLIVTEKNITARKIAQILIKSVKEKKVDGVSVYEGDDTSVIGLSGHIVNIDFTAEYNNWQNTAPRNLIWADTETQYTQKKIATALKKLSKAADRITIATDFDREGEMIGVEAYNIIREANPDVKFDRARYSAITRQEIRVRSRILCPWTLI
jgi:DNA topoisomerase-1